MDNQDYVKIFDTTLRDGEQSPHVTMNIKEKLELARQLEKLNVDIIEAGFPIVSPGDFEAVRLVSQEIQTSTICALARCRDEDIDKAAEALELAKNKRIHVFVATSEIHRKYKFNKAQEEILQIAIEGVKRARSLVDDVEFSPEDAARTELPFLAQITEAVIEAGATTINIPDTVGYITPFEFAEVIRYLKEHVPNIDKVTLSVHCHDDLGMAVANSLSALMAGARQVECTINGIGERAGNCSMEEVVMALKTRKKYFGFETGVTTREFYKTSRMVSDITGLVVQPNKAIVGANAFVHEAGIHQDGMLKNRETYEIMNPKDVGWGESELVIGKHSGRHAFEKDLEAKGLTLKKKDLEVAFQLWKVVCDKQKVDYNEDVASIVANATLNTTDLFSSETVTLNTTDIVSLESVTLNTTDIFSLESVEMGYHFKANDERSFPKAKVLIKDAKKDSLLMGEAVGDGPVDAIFQAMEQVLDMDVTVLNYTIRSVTRGQDALGEVTVKVSRDGKRPMVGRAASTDILEASAKAFLLALNRVVRA